MIDADSNAWRVPPWQPAWDGDFQFQGLRAFADAIGSATDLSSRPEVIEEGYVRLVVLCGVTVIGVLYVNRSENGVSPVFAVYAGADDDELQTTDVAAGVEFLSGRRTSFQDSR